MIVNKGSLHEQGFNYVLSQAIRAPHVRWRESDSYVFCERSGILPNSANRPDILIDDPSISKVIIECAYGGDGDKDALKRLTDRSCDTAISVNIPLVFQDMSEDEATSELRNGRQLLYAVMQQEQQRIFRFPHSGYVSGTANELSALVLSASSPKDHIEKTADRVTELINRGALELHNGLSEADRVLVTSSIFQRTPLTAFRTAMVLWLDAMLVQAHLRKQLGDKVKVLPMGSILPSQLVSSWNEILKYNWYSIFSPAVQTLESVSEKARGAVSQAMRFLSEAVEIIESARIGDHISIGGELFPKISDDRKKAAAYYTTPPTAELLASLLIRKHDSHDWGDTELFKNCQIADFACGTGTLLRAAFHRIRSFHEISGGGTDTLAQLHIDAMESGFKGVDISPVATHLTSSSLALLGAGMPYGKTSIGWISVGEPIQNGMTTGSLELLESAKMNDIFSKYGESESGSELNEDAIEIGDESLDYVIMNPPYSRTRGGQSAFDVAGLSSEQRTLCQKRWGHLIRREQANKQAGMAASFLCLATKKVKRGGRIGFVLPYTAAFAESWNTTRKMLVREFKDIVVVGKAGATGGRDALSADTNMGEMLFIGTKRQKSGLPAKVCCVTLNRMPIRQGEAGEFGRSIDRVLQDMPGDTFPLMAGNEELGHATHFIPASEGEEPWSHLGVMNPILATASRHLVLESALRDICEGGDDLGLDVSFTIVSELFKVGPTHHLIGHHAGGDSLGAFRLHPITNRADARYGVRSLWQADASSQSSLLVEPTHKGAKWSDDSDRMLNLRGTLHYARGMRWTSQAILAGTTEHEVFGGSAWTSLLHENPKVLKAFALWANSTLGLVTHWTRASRTHLGRARTQVKAIHEIPCPNFAHLNDGALDIAVRAFDALSAKKLKPACQSHADPVRAEMDETVVQMLSLPSERSLKNVRALCELWCSEPTVHGNNSQAVKLLKEKELVD